ncbi:MAG: 7-cyano-7-deazaguanine synthase QueC [Spirochaetes bacterium]|jgi:7-cyano-7-deazaguanine synthase|nr:7-cyano-7-deazaguanine synthase QueC [Spirochaetota bacterium]HRU66243.1 7-cyano-7-deazaguanine synthase QueC [Spirochaetota bacterium]
MAKVGIVLLSGGLDSATVAAIARNEGYDLHAMTFLYSQRHKIEVLFAERLVQHFGIKKHIKIEIPSEIFQTALVEGSNISVPKNRDIDETSIPETYVPGRNILFLSYALAYGESVGADAIFIGANAVDYSGYPDCRPDFFEAFKKMADKGTKAGVEGRGINIFAPLMYLKKHEIIKLGISLGVDYSLTHSCYDPFEDGSSCGNCDSCILRKRGFAEAGVADPTKYREQ